MRLQIVAVRTVVFGLLLCPLLGTVQGQWLSYPTAGVPRTPDGKPNLGAACPRTADGKPDLSGLWIMQTKRPGNADFPGCDPVADEFINIAGSLKGGLPYQPWAADLVKSAPDGATRERSHVALCPNRANTPAYLEWTQKNGAEPWAADYSE